MRARKPADGVLEAFEAFGVRVSLKLDGVEVQEGVREILPPGWRPSPPTRAAADFELRRVGNDTYEVREQGRAELRCAPLEMALDVLDARIRHHISLKASDWTFVHAGVVASAGRALLIPGLSFSGKTTLVKALVEAGAMYYSDEFAVLDDDGRVHPYARRLSLRTGAGSDELHVGELGGVAGERAADVAMLVLTRYLPGHDWSPRRLSSGQGVAAMLTDTVPAHKRPAKSLRAVSRALAGALVLEGDRGEADSVAPALLAELEALGRSG